MNTQKILSFGLIINSLLTIALLIAVVKIFNNQYDNNMEYSLNAKNVTAIVKKPVSVPLIAKTVEIPVNDTGFENIGFSARTGEIIVLSIKNTGQKDHSLKIDELKIDSGAIAPGATATLQLPAFGSEPKDYEYYSGIDGKINKFTGIIAVLKK